MADNGILLLVIESRPLDLLKLFQMKGQISLARNLVEEIMAVGGGPINELAEDIQNLNGQEWVIDLLLADSILTDEDLEVLRQVANPN